MPGLMHVMPSLFPGVLYDGDGTLLAGDGPALFSNALVDAYPVRTIVQRPRSPEKTALRQGDRIWLLPDDLDTSALPSAITAEFLVVIHHYGWVSLGGRAGAAVQEVADALLLLMASCMGNA